MFTPGNAWMALENTEQYLLGPLGMKTLDPRWVVFHASINSVFICKITGNVAKYLEVYIQTFDKVCSELV